MGGGNLIIAALKDEVRIFLSKMSLDCVVHLKPATFYRGKFLNREIALLVTGLGAKRAEEGVKSVLALENPKYILLVGYAGGATPIVSVGSLVISREVIEEKTERHFSCDPALLEQAKKICEQGNWNYHVGNLVSVDRVIASPYEKADLGATYSSLALEMEAAALAKVAQERNIPFLVVKAILDPVEEWVPQLEGCYEETGEPNLMKLTEKVWRSPKEMMKLPKLYYWASQARSSITKFLEGWILVQ